MRELQVNKEKFRSPGPKDDVDTVMEEFEMNIITALYLCTIVTKLLQMNESGVNGARDRERSYRLVYMLNRMNLKLRDGQTLLHLAVNGVTPVDDFHTSDVCRFPCVETVKLLLCCGASVSVTDCIRNSPLHTLTATVSRNGQGWGKEWGCRAERPHRLLDSWISKRLAILPSRFAHFSVRPAFGRALCPASDSMENYRKYFTRFLSVLYG